MTDTKLSSLEYKILRYINDTNACHYLDAISADSIPASSSEIRDLLGHLVEIKAVHLPPLPPDLNSRILSVTSFGTSLLQQFEETEEQERLTEEKRLAEKKSDRRHNWAVSVSSAIIGAVAGGLVGYISALFTLKAG